MPKQALPFLHFTLSSVPACFHSPVSLYWACLQSALIDFCHFPLYSITYPNLYEYTHILIIATSIHIYIEIWNFSYYSFRLVFSYKQVIIADEPNDVPLVPLLKRCTPPFSKESGHIFSTQTPFKHIISPLSNPGQSLCRSQVLVHLSSGMPLSNPSMSLVVTQIEDPLSMYTL